MKEEDVRSRYESSPRQAGEWRSPEQLAVAFEDALRWRAEWRAREIGENQKKNGEKVPAPSVAPPPDERKRRANFATAIARAEFGRFYRNGRTETKPPKMKAPKKEAPKELVFRR
jgi:hypothetical protein